MLQTIETIQKLKQTEYVQKRDSTNVLALYEKLREIIPQTEDFTAISGGMMSEIKAGQSSDESVKCWLERAETMFMSALVIKLYGERRSFSMEEAERFSEYFYNCSLAKEIKAFGIYACARFFEVTDPMRCYRETTEAFQLYPMLGQIMNIDYVYRGQEESVHKTERCPFCNSESTEPYYCAPQIMKLSGRSVFPPSKLWMKCHECDNLYTYNFPLTAVDNINGHYTAELEEGRLKGKFNLYIYNEIFTRLKELAGGRDYLEIGAGTGEMAAVAQEFGYHVDVVDICHADAIRVGKALDVNVSCCDIVDYETDKQYDVIVMGDVFEHVTRPVEVLRKVRGMLKDGGVLWLSTPNYNSAYARMEKFDHAMWYELNHYTYTSYEAMECLLDKLGMQIVRYDMSRRYLGSMELYIINDTAKF